MKYLVFYRKGLILDRSYSPETYRHTEQSMFWCFTCRLGVLNTLKVAWM